jgi:hypothetical protein
MLIWKILGIILIKEAGLKKRSGTIHSESWETTLVISPSIISRLRCKSLKVMFRYGYENHQDNEMHILLCRVITGVEGDLSEDISKAVELSLKDKSKEKFRTLEQISKPNYSQLNEAFGDSHMFKMSEVLQKVKQVTECCQQDVVPQMDEKKATNLKKFKCAVCRNLIDKESKDESSRMCSCHEQTEFYSVYSPDRVYPEYLITLKVDEGPDSDDEEEKEVR